MGIALLCLYAMAIAWMAGRKGGTAAAFFVNNRSSSTLEVAFSIVASCVGASATIGMVGMAFAVGTPAFWWLGAGAGGLSLLSLLLARKVRESGAYTMPQLVERYLGASARPLISLIIVIAWMAILAAQFVAATGVMQALTGFSQGLSLGLGFLFIVLHARGGQSAIMRLDRLQAVMLVAALLGLLGWLTAHNPSWPGLTPVQAVNPEFPPERLVYFLVVIGANYLICPMLFGRLFSARDGAAASRGGLLAAGGLAFCAVLIVSVGLACKGLVLADTPQDAVLTRLFSDVLPDWMRLLMSLALLSAIVSSADSCLITAATVLSHDLLKRSDPAAGRVCVLVLGLAGLGLSLCGKGVIGFLLMAYDVYACGVVAPVFVGFLLERRGGIEPAYARAAVAVGGALGLAAALSGQAAYSYAGMAVAAAIALGGFRKSLFVEAN